MKGDKNSQRMLYQKQYVLAASFVMEKNQFEETAKKTEIKPTYLCE